jgi:hypothetical protein
MSVEAVTATHYRVICVLCRVDAFVCPARDTSIDAWTRAVSAFRRAGWHYDPPTHRQPKARRAAEEMGAGRWYCPACARRRP